MVRNTHEHHCPWLYAAGRVGPELEAAASPARVREPLRALHRNLLMMCRAHFAVERSYDRFRAARATLPGLEGQLLQYLEAHAFLVSACLAWDTLATIKLGLLPLRSTRGISSALTAAMGRHAPVRARLAAARHSMEHITELMREGRKAPGGDAVVADAFRQALGRCEGTTVLFGDERVDLTEQAAALDAVRASVAGLIGGAVRGAAGPSVAGAVA
jgi:hypothetical protein